MADLPLPVSQFVLTYSERTCSLAYLQVDPALCLSSWGGNLAMYGISDLQQGVEAGKQLLFLEGIFPLQDASLLLPCVEIGAGIFADIHIFSHEEHTWVLLFDVTQEEKQRRLFQQKVNELSLLGEKHARVGDQASQRSGGGEALLADLFSVLDVVLLKRCEDGSFSTIGTVPDWAAPFYKNAPFEKEGCQLETKSAFLGNFLIDAERFWQAKSVGRLRSGPWSESDLAGNEMYLEASAVCVGLQKVLLIEQLGVIYDERHSLIQRARENSLQYSRLETRLHVLLNRLNVGVFRSTVDGRVLEANPAFWRFLRLNSLEGSRDCNLIEMCMQPEEGLQLLTRLQQDPRLHEHEVRLRGANGTAVWGLLTAVRNTTLTGEAVLDGLIEDITARKRAEEAQKKEAEVSEALARVGSEMISLLDIPAILNRLCQLTTEVLGCDSSHTFIRQPEEDVFVPMAGCGDYPEQWETLRALKIPRSFVADLFTRLEREHVVQLLTSNSHDSFMMELQRRYGVTVALYIALRRGETIVGCLSAGYRGRQAPFSPHQERIAKGIAQLASLALENARLIEQLEEASRLKEEFLASVSHELRTPLHIILGYIDLLLDETFGVLTTEQIDTLQRVSKNAHALFALLSTVLDLGRLEMGRLPLELQDLHLPDLIAEIEAETKGWREKPGLHWTWKVAPELPPLLTDSPKLKAIIKNLLSNAVKFTEQGTVSVDIRPHDGGVEIGVTDTGIGISPDKLSIIFEPFRQADSSTTRRYGGVGLGLYVVRRLLEVLGGTITVESEVGHGSTFRIWLSTRATG